MKYMSSPTKTKSLSLLLTSLFIVTLLMTGSAGAKHYLEYKYPGTKVNLISSPDAKSIPVRTTIDKPLYKEGEIVIRYNDTIASTDKVNLLSQYGLTLLKTGRELNYQVAKVPKGKTVKDLAAALSKDSRVKFAEPNYLFYASTLPNDRYLNDTSYKYTGIIENNKTLTSISYPAWTVDSSTTTLAIMYTYQPYNYDMGLSQLPNMVYNTGTSVYDLNQGSSGIKIAVVDTGVDRLHDDLRGNVLRGYDFVNNDGDPADDFGHGTHVAGIIAALTNNRKGMASMAPKCKIIPIKVLGSDGTGQNGDIADGILAAGRRYKAQIINMSFGNGAALTYPGMPLLIYDAINKVKQYGCHLVAAAGNEGNNYSATGNVDWTFPAMFSGVISVGSWDYQYDNSGNPVMLAYSNHGNHGMDVSYPDGEIQGDIRGVDIFAPGGSDSWSPILSTVPYNHNLNIADADKYQDDQGTSMAAPQVAGLIGLMMSKGIQDRTAVIYALYSTSFNPTNFQYGNYTENWGYGMIDPAYLFNNFQLYNNLTYIDNLITDTPYNGRYGNGNYALNPGETVDMTVALENTGVSPCYQVYGVISTDDENVTIITNGANFGDMYTSQYTISSSDYRFFLKSNIDVTNGYTIRFMLYAHFKKSDGTWGVQILPIDIDVSSDGEVLDNLVLMQASMNDNSSDSTLGLYGNNNGIWENGERVGITATLSNTGINGAFNVYGTLSTDDPNLTIMRDTAYYGTILSNDQVDNSPHYIVTLSPSVDTSAPYNCHFILYCSYTTLVGTNKYAFLPFDLTANSASTSTTGYTPLNLLVYGGYTADDNSSDTTTGKYGNGNGILNPGEIADLKVGLLNAGANVVLNVFGTLSTSDPYINLSSHTSGYGAIAVGTTGYNYFGYRLKVSDSAYDGYTAHFVMNVTYQTMIGTTVASVIPFDIGIVGLTQSTTTTVGNTYEQLILNNYQIIDDSSSGRNGNGNHLLNPDETVDIELVLKNIGLNPALITWGTLSVAPADNGNAFISQDTAFYGNIYPNATTTHSPYYRFRISPNMVVGSGRYLNLNLHCSYANLLGSQKTQVVPILIPIYSKVGGVYHTVDLEHIDAYTYTYNGIYRTLLNDNGADDNTQSLIQGYTEADAAQVGNSNGHFESGEAVEIRPALINNSGFVFHDTPPYNGVYSPLLGHMYLQCDIPNSYPATYPQGLLRIGQAVQSYGTFTEYWNESSITTYYVNQNSLPIFDYNISDLNPSQYLMSNAPNRRFGFAMLEYDLQMNGDMAGYQSYDTTSTYVVSTSTRWLDRFPICYARETVLALDHYEILDNNYNNIIEPGETFRLKPFVTNYGIGTVISRISAEIHSNDPYLSFSVRSIEYFVPGINHPTDGVRGNTLNSTFAPITTGFEMTVSPYAPQNHKFYFNMSIHGRYDTTGFDSTAYINGSDSTWNCPFVVEMGSLVLYDGMTGLGNPGLQGYRDNMTFFETYMNNVNSYFGPNASYGVRIDDSVAYNSNYDYLSTATYTNGDGWVNPGERIKLGFSLWNRYYDQSLYGLKIIISSPNSKVHFTKNTLDFGSISPREIKTLSPSQGFEFFTGVNFSDTSIPFVMTITDSYGNSFIQQFTLPVVINFPPQVPGFPKNTGAPMGNSVTIADLDKNGITDILVGNENGAILGYKLAVADYNNPASVADISQVWSVQAGNPVRVPVAVGDINHSGVNSVIAVSADGSLYGWQSTGASWGSNGLMVNTRSVYNGKLLTTPVLADISQNSSLRIIVGGEITLGPATTYGNLYAFDYNGNAIGYFGTKSTYLLGPIAAAPAIGDIDNDNKLEVVVVSQYGEIAAYRGDGSRIFYNVQAGVVFNSPPVIARLDLTGKASIIAKASNGMVYGYYGNGSTVSGFPLTSGGSAATPPIIGDINGDNIPDVIVAGTDNFNFITYNNGRPVISPLQFQSRFSDGQPALADVNLTTAPEFFHTLTDGRLHAFTFGDNHFSLYSTNQLNFINSSPAIGKFTNSYATTYQTVSSNRWNVEGQLQNNAVIVTSTTGLVYAYIHRWEADSTAYYWPQYRHDQWHTGFYSQPGVAVSTGTANIDLTNFSFVDDPNVSGLYGNGNGILNPGEIVDLSINLRNNSAVAAYNIFGTIATADPNITISTNTASWGSLYGGFLGVNSPAYRMSINPLLNTTNGYTATFVLTVVYTSLTNTTSTAIFTITSPIVGTYQAAENLIFSSYTINDQDGDGRSGNGNLLLNPGETVDVEVALQNIGTSPAYNVYSVLSTNDANVAISTISTGYGDIDVNQISTNTPAFRIRLNPSISVTTGYVIHFIEYSTYTTRAGTVGNSTAAFNIPVYRIGGAVYHAVNEDYTQFYNGLFFFDANDDFMEVGETIQANPVLRNRTLSTFYTDTTSTWPSALRGTMSVFQDIMLDDTATIIDGNLNLSNNVVYYSTATDTVTGRGYVADLSKPLTDYNLSVTNPRVDPADQNYGFSIVEFALTTTWRNTPSQLWLDRTHVTYNRPTATALDHYEIVDANGDNIIQPGETIRLKTYVRNASRLPYLTDAGEALTGTLSSADPYVTISVPSNTYPLPGFNAIEGPNESGFELTISPNIPHNHPITFLLTITGTYDTADLNTTRDYLPLETVWNCPFIIDPGVLALYDGPNGTYNVQISDNVSLNTTLTFLTTGTFNNGDGRINPGERISLSLSAWNKRFDHEINGVTAELKTTTSGVNLTVSTAAVGTIGPRILKKIPTPFEFWLPVDFNQSSIDFTLTLKDNLGNPYISKFTLSLVTEGFVPPSVPGFPYYTGAAIYGSPTLADLNDDGITEIIVGNEASKVNAVPLAISPNGVQNIYGWPANAGASIRNPVAVGDIDGSGSKSVVGVGSDGNLYAWHDNGAEYGSLGLLVNVANLGTGQGLNTAPALADLDGDGALDIISGGFSNQGDTTYGMLYAFNYQGNVIGFFGTLSTRLNGPITTPPAVTYFPGDDLPEIVVVTQKGEIAIFNSKGILIRKLTLTGSTPINAPPVLGDIDGDLSPDIIVKATDGNVYIYSYNLALLNTIPTGGSGTIPPVLSDLNNDGTPDIIVGGTDSLQILDVLNNLITPILLTGGYSNAQPAVADVDLTTDAEIAFTASNGSLHVNRFDGTPIYTVNGIAASYCSPAIGRFTNAAAAATGGDPMNNAVIITSTNGRIYAYMRPYESDPGLAYWPQYRRDPRHTAAYSQPPDSYIYAVSWTTDSTPYKGSFDYSGDIDWLSFEGIAGHNYRITAVPRTGSSASPVIALFTPSLVKVKSSIKTIEHMIDADGTYYLSVTNSGSLSKSNNGYDVVIVDLDAPTEVTHWSLYSN